jgi:cell division protein FtsX
MSGFLLFKRGMLRGWTTLKRERGWGTSLWALLGVVVLAQVFLLACIGVQGVGALLRSQTDLRLQVREGATDRQVQEFFAALQQQPFVSSVAYITREQAYERERRTNPDLVGFLEKFNIQNPFPDTLAVTLGNLSLYEDFEAFVREEAWREVVDPAFLSQATDQEQQLHQMLRLTEAGRSVMFFFFALTGGILLFVVVELVRRRAYLRREEVFVERMSGAQEASVVLPFATEAAVLLSTALALSFVFLVLLLFSLPVFLPAIAEGGTFTALRGEVQTLLLTAGPAIIVAEFLLAPAMGFLGAFLGTRGQRLSLASV